MHQDGVIAYQQPVSKADAKLKTDGKGCCMTVAKSYRKRYGYKVAGLFVLLHYLVDDRCKTIAAPVSKAARPAKVQL